MNCFSKALDAPAVAVGCPVCRWRGSTTVSLPSTQPTRGKPWLVHFYGYLRHREICRTPANRLLTVDGMAAHGRNGSAAAKIGRKTRTDFGKPSRRHLRHPRFQSTRKRATSHQSIFSKNAIRNREQQCSKRSTPTATYGVQIGQTIADPNKKSQNYAWSGHTQAHTARMFESSTAINRKTEMAVAIPGNSQRSSQYDERTIPAIRNRHHAHPPNRSNSAAMAYFS